MSLINDALKRASELDKNRPPATPSERPMQPVAAAPSRQPAWIWLSIVLILIFLAASFFWQWRRESRHVAAAPAKAAAAVVAKSAAAPPPVAAPAAAPAPAPAPTPPPASPPRKAPVVAPAPVKPTPEPVAAPAFEAPWPASLTLQGIFYSKTHPLALINGKTVAPGESVTGVVVDKIEPDQVTLQWNGHSKILFLNEH